MLIQFPSDIVKKKKKKKTQRKAIFLSSCLEMHRVLLKASRRAALRCSRHLLHPEEDVLFTFCSLPLPARSVVPDDFVPRD